MIIVTRTGGTAPIPAIDVNPALDLKHFGYLLIEPDGTVWDLVAGPVVIQQGLRGVGIPPPTHWKDELAGLDGAHHRGMRTGPREVVIPVKVAGKSSEEILEIDSRFGKAISPERLLQFVIVAPDATFRSLDVRYDTGGEGEYTTDLLLNRFAVYPLEWSADAVWWHTSEVVVSIRSGDPVSFFPGPPFPIGQASTFGSAEVTNPGDKPVWGRWIIGAPFTGVTVGLAEGSISLTTTKTSGFIEIDTDPAHRVIVDETGADIRDAVTDVKFAPVPPGTVDLVVQVDGATSASFVEMHLLPNHERAW